MSQVILARGERPVMCGAGLRVRACGGGVRDQGRGYGRGRVLESCSPGAAAAHVGLIRGFVGINLEIV